MTTARPSGHVYRHEGRRGPVWRALYRLPDGPGPELIREHWPGPESSVNSVLRLAGQRAPA